MPQSTRTNTKNTNAVVDPVVMLVVTAQWYAALPGALASCQDGPEMLFCESGVHLSFFCLDLFEN